MNRQMRMLSREGGQAVLWYAYDPASSTVDDVYDEGGARMWKLPFPLPTLGIWRSEGTEFPSDRGLYTVDTVRFVTSVDLARRAGMDQIENTLFHLNDRFIWDGLVWDVRSFHREGRIADAALEILVGATQVKPEEVINDPQFMANLTLRGLWGKTLREMHNRTLRDVSGG